MYKCLLSYRGQCVFLYNLNNFMKGETHMKKLLAIIAIVAILIGTVGGCSTSSKKGLIKLHEDEIAIYWAENKYEVIEAEHTNFFEALENPHKVEGVDYLVTSNKISRVEWIGSKEGDTWEQLIKTQLDENLNKHSYDYYDSECYSIIYVFKFSPDGNTYYYIAVNI